MCPRGLTCRKPERGTRTTPGKRVRPALQFPPHPRQQARQNDSGDKVRCLPVARWFFRLPEPSRRIAAHGDPSSPARAGLRRGTAFALPAGADKPFPQLRNFILHVREAAEDYESARRENVRSRGRPCALRHPGAGLRQRFVHRSSGCRRCLLTQAS